MARAPVDIVVPYVGSDAGLLDLLVRLRAIRREPADTLTVVDNRPARAGAPEPGADVVRAPERQSSYFARNRGAERGAAPWIVFLDADVEAEPDLLERYFEPLPAPGTGLLAGRVEPTLAPGAGPVTRYGVLRGHLEIDGQGGAGGREHALTANLAVRREAFAAVSGFVDGIRSGGDADFCFRVQDAGWGLERRPDARVRHPTRASVGALVRVFARYGSGAQWLWRRYPDFQPPGSVPRVLVVLLAAGVRVPLAAVRGRPDETLTQALDPLVSLAFELGRFAPNHTGAGRREQLRYARRVLRERRRHRRR